MHEQKEGRNKMITERFINERLDENTKNILRNSSFEELLNPGKSVPGGLISYRHREKTAVVKIKRGIGEGEVTPNSDFASLEQLIAELTSALKEYGKVYFPLHSRFRNSTLCGCNTITVVCEGKPIFELTLTLVPYKDTFLQMDPAKITLPNEFKELSPEEMTFIKTVQPWTKHNADLAFNGECSWTKCEYITLKCIPLESRVVISNGKLVSDIIMSRANLIIAI